MAGAEVIFYGNSLYLDSLRFIGIHPDGERMVAFSATGPFGFSDGVGRGDFGKHIFAQP